MATSKLNKEQYANIGTFAGIMLVYNSTNRDGETVQTAQHFFGKDFEPADKSDNEIFRVIKNMVATMWHTIAEEKKLRADADGIRSKFRATTPAEIIICDKSNNRIKRYDLTDSVWARIGLVPTKVDLEKSSRDFAKTIHAAAKAIRDAMNFAPNLAGLEKAEKPAKTAQTATTATADMPEPPSEQNAPYPPTHTSQLCPQCTDTGRPDALTSAGACHFRICRKGAYFPSMPEIRPFHIGRKVS